jgi:hypothetical protein
MDLQKEINKIKGLAQNKGKSEAELEAIVKEQQDKKIILEHLAFCINDEEKLYATDLLNRYLSQKTFENEAEKDTLGQLIDQELLAERFKAILKKDYGATNPSQSVEIVEQLDGVVDRIESLKDKLGLTAKDAIQNSFQDVWNEMKKKVLKYYEETKGCNVTKCPYCQHIYQLTLRTEKLTPEQCSWFKGTILYNRDVFKLYDEKRITTEETAKILGTSVYYVEMLYNNIYLKEKSENDRKN